MTGFGRTGDWFACIKSQVAPDIICLSKGITGGFLPLSVTICSEKIYDTFYSDDPIKTLYCGHSYTAKFKLSLSDSFFISSAFKKVFYHSDTTGINIISYRINN